MFILDSCSYLTVANHKQFMSHHSPHRHFLPFMDGAGSRHGPMLSWYLFPPLTTSWQLLIPIWGPILLWERWHHPWLQTWNSWPRRSQSVHCIPPTSMIDFQGWHVTPKGPTGQLEWISTYFLGTLGKATHSLPWICGVWVWAWFSSSWFC